MGLRIKGRNNSFDVIPPLFLHVLMWQTSRIGVKDLSDKMVIRQFRVKIFRSPTT